VKLKYSFLIFFELRSFYFTLFDTGSGTCVKFLAFLLILLNTFKHSFLELVCSDFDFFGNILPQEHKKQFPAKKYTFALARNANFSKYRLQLYE